MLAPGCLERMKDELREALPFDHRFELNPHLNASGESGIGGSVEYLGQAGVPNQPDGHQVAGIEGEVEKGREVFEELGRQVLGFVDDPDGQQIFAIDPFQNAGLEVAPELGTAVGGFDP